MHTMTIELEVLDSSTLQIAYAIIKHCMRANDIPQNGVIDLEEIADHITAFANAERKQFELRKELAQAKKGDFKKWVD